MTKQHPHAGQHSDTTRPAIVNVSPISEQRYQVGESPVWDDRARLAYFVDIKGHLLCSFDPGTGKSMSWRMSEDIGFVALTNTPKLILGLRSGLALFDPASGRQEPFGQVPVAADERINDGKVDARGELYFGKMAVDASPTRGVLYRLDKGLDLAIVADGYDIPNGPAFAADGSLYHCDTPHGLIYRIERDGEAWRQCEAFHIDKDTGTPDGVSVDPFERLWAGLWGGGCLWVGGGGDAQTYRLPIPASYVTSLCPVGIYGNQLLVTSANSPILRGVPSQEPHDGCVFLVEIDFHWPAISARFALPPAS